MQPPHKLTDEEKALLKRAMKDVTPLGKSPPSPACRRGARGESLSISRAKPPVTTEIHLSDYYENAVDAETTLSYKKPDFPKNRFLDLKSGSIRFEDKLDLHGLTIDTARTELCNFLNLAKHRGIRCVLIIHGKGRQAHNPPLLKNHVNNWLKQLPDTLAFHSALPKHGGAGAVYVYIKKLM